MSEFKVLPINRNDEFTWIAVEERNDPYWIKAVFFKTEEDARLYVVNLRLGIKWTPGYFSPYESTTMKGIKMWIDDFGK